MKNLRIASNKVVKSFCLCMVCILLSFNGWSQKVTVYQTTKNGGDKLQKKGDIYFGGNTSGGKIIYVNGGKSYQTIDGFGAAMTGSSAYLFNKKMNSTQRNNVMNSLFGSGGIKLTFIRHSIGASDFSLSDYTYHDPGTSFSINKDKADVIPMLKLAKQKRSNLKIMGTPWTAPAWMKTNNSMFGGSLKGNHEEDYADYLINYLNAFKNEGVNIYAITIQNEPLHTTSSYPSMRMEWYQQSNIIRYHLGPKLSSNNLNTKILIYDHNWDNTTYARDILNEAATVGYVAGTAFHGYAGGVSAQTTVYNYNKNKGIWFTEQSGGDWSTNFGDNLSWYARNLLIGSIRNWSKSVLLWNLALDKNDGPQNGGCSNCRGVVTVNDNGSFTKEVEYYALGHLSKFVNPGAKRIETNLPSDIDNVAFRNGDGTFVVLAFNKSSSSRFVKVRHGGKQFGYNIPGGALVTFKWSPSSSRQELPENDETEELTDEFAKALIYPNPIENVFSVNITQFGVDKATFTLVDLSGQVVYEHRLTNQITEINLENSFTSGIYYAFIEGDGFARKTKVLIR